MEQIINHHARQPVGHIANRPARIFNQAWMPLIFALILGSLLLACGTAAPQSPSETAAPASQVDAAPTSGASTNTLTDSTTNQSESMTDPTPIVVAQPDDGRPSKAELAAVFSPSSTSVPEVAEATAAPSPTAHPEATVAPSPTAPPEPAATASPAPTMPPTPTPRPSGGGTKGGLAAELKGIQAWINSDPLTIDGLHGKVVLIDFWTYTCINCIRTLPYLKEWHAKYQDDGLVIIGVHTPEFEFEKDLDNVVKATRDYGVEWAVAQDTDFRTWRAYANRYWPAKYLIDHEGIVRYTHFGEGEYAETELKIRELLEKAGADLAADPFNMPLDQNRDQTYLNSRGTIPTRELYAGYKRALSSYRAGHGVYVGQLEYYRTPDEPTELMIPDEVQPHKMYFNGLWTSESENAKHARASQDYEDFLEVVYSARSVNAVLTSDSGEPYRVQITQDGEFLTEDNKGADVIIGEDGESYILVTEPKMYRVIENPTYVEERNLRMASDSENFGLFAFTFGVYESGA